MCIEVQALCPQDRPDCSPLPPVIAQITSTCTSCTASDLSISQDAFQRLGGSIAAGRLPISYRGPVECTPPGNMSLSILEYRAAEGGYLRLVPFNVAGASGISSVELRQTPLSVSTHQPVCRHVVGMEWPGPPSASDSACKAESIPSPYGMQSLFLIVVCAPMSRRHWPAGWPP